jgi:putative ABC transport system permease protein
MNFTIKTFIHYFKQNLLVALGVVVSTAVLTGALIIGDSVRYSLKQSTFSRLGNHTPCFGYRTLFQAGNGSRN